jgi:hypothetical protein
MSQRGISKLVKGLESQESDEQDINNFRSEMLDISEKAIFSVPREVVTDLWGEVSYDDNPLHSSKEHAISLGYNDVITQGTYLAAKFEQYILDSLSVINDFVGETFVYSGQDLEFKRPLYPDSIAKWTQGKVKTYKDGVDWNVSLINDSGKLLVEGNSKLRYKKREPTLSDLANFAEGKFVTEIRKDIGENLKSYYECLGMTPKKGVPFMYPGLLLPASLLDFLAKNNTPHEGVYSKLSLDFHNQPGVGEYKTIMRMPNPPTVKRRTGYEYNFDAACIQEGTHILDGSINAFSKKEYTI